MRHSSDHLCPNHCTSSLVSFHPSHERKMHRKPLPTWNHSTGGLAENRCLFARGFASVCRTAVVKPTGPWKLTSWCFSVCQFIGWCGSLSRHMVVGELP